METEFLQPLPRLPGDGAVLSQEVCGSIPFPAGVMRFLLATGDEGLHLLQMPHKCHVAQV